MLVRILNTFFLAAAGLSCLALYHVSEQTRVERVKLASVERQIADEKSTMNVLQAEWQRVANPERIQHLAETRLGMDDTPAVELSSFEMLPRRGEESPLNPDPVQNASLVAPAQSASNLHLVVARGN